MKFRAAVVAAGLGLLIAPVMASAGEQGSMGMSTGRERTIRGCVENFSPFQLDLKRGPHVQLHHGTIIRPTGIQLNNGMRVKIHGHRDGDVFDADYIRVIHGACREHDWAHVPGGPGGW